jgi:ornithine cyclodeaminase
MRVVALPEILAALDEAEALRALEEGFRRFSAGEVDSMAVGHLAFADPPGDCHVKGARLGGDDVFVVKLATGFYRNSERGLANSNGFMAVLCAHTGAVHAILHDEGQLTDVRTALAGAIAARAIQRSGSKVLGVVGAGVQARLQAERIGRTLGLSSVLLWARREDCARTLAREIGAEAVPLAELCARADLIVTTTPATEPILTAPLIRPGTRIVAVGADAPGKRELAVELVARAALVVDSRAQCAHHGEVGWAIRAGLVDERAPIELGALLARPVHFAEDAIVIADLTGLGVQDVQIAKAVWSRLRAA